MAYYLRKTKRKNGGIHFQVYDSYYSMDEKKNRSVETLGLLLKLRKDAKQIGEYMQKRTSLPLLGKRLTDSKIKSFFDPKNAGIGNPGK